MEREPVQTFNVHDHLRPKLCDLYESDSIFDKYEATWSHDDRCVWPRGCCCVAFWFFWGVFFFFFFFFCSTLSFLPFSALYVFQFQPLPPSPLQASDDGLVQQPLSHL